jgi:hypothetical protein
MLDLYSFVLEHSLKMAPLCRNMQEFDTCHEVYFIVFYGLNLLSDVLGENATLYV